MPTYIIQSQWTDQGIRNVKESATRLDLGKKKLKEMGGDIKAFYLTTGSYDMLAVVDVPDDATLARHLLDVQEGKEEDASNVRSSLETMDKIWARKRAGRRSTNLHLRS
jgi:uncharacterized protein with GYD domain